MKKRTIWIIGILMTVAFLGLAVLQFLYIRKASRYMDDVFNKNASLSLSQISQTLKEQEIKEYLDETVHKYTKRNAQIELDKLKQKKENELILSGDTLDLSYAFFVPKISISEKHGQKSLVAASDEIFEKYRNRFFQSKTLLDQVAMQWMKESSSLPINERIKFDVLPELVNTTLKNNGIELPYHFSIINQKDSVFFFCESDSLSVPHEVTDSSSIYRQCIFQGEKPSADSYFIEICFPTQRTFIASSLTILLPAFVLIILLLAMFLFTIVTLFRQTKLSILKTDFVNNMTHELKTPISSISLAVQMMQDNAISKTPERIQYMSNVIAKETKRLQFLVDKVLQTSLYEKKIQRLFFTEIEANETINTILSTFSLNVEGCGGKIISTLSAENAWIMADEVHFTNVIYNLMENAVKYRKDDVLILEIRTWNEKNYFCLSVIDNGIGIKKEQQKRIFDKFYRVPTGNVHNVKGFGLGLAYVKAIVEEHKGKISVESEWNIGTTFTIKIPTLKL